MNEVLFGLDYLVYYFYLLYYRFMGYPFVLRVCVVIVTACVAFYIVLSLYIFFGIFRRRKRKRKAYRIEQRFYGPIKSVSADPQRRREREIAEILNHDPDKRLKADELKYLTQQMIRVRMELGDSINEFNFEVIQDIFRVSRYFEREIQFGRDSDKVQALKSVQSMNGYISEAVLVRFLYDRKVELRYAARFAYMWLSQNDPFRFFDEDIAMQLRKWDMAELHTIIKHRQDTGFPIPSFMKWVDGQVEDDVKIFFVNEIKYFNQTDSCPPLAELITSRNLALRSEVIRTLGAMRYRPSEKKMVDSYDVQPEYIKWDIIDAVSEMKSGNGTSFLWQAYEESDDMTTRLHILQALYNYDETGRAAFEGLEEQAEGFSKQLFAHVKNPLINRAT